MNQEAVVKEKKSLYFVWIIPLVAMLIAGWMIFKYYDEKGFDIKVEFSNANGMIVGKTALIYNGIPIGIVSAMTINKSDISKVDVTITVDKKAKGVAREGNVFWKVEPKVSLTEVTGLSTILSGAYIGIMPKSKDLNTLISLKEKYRFIAHTKAPIDIFSPGLLLKLHASSSNINVGAPILYKKITIGKVLEVKLINDQVQYLISINKEYANLVKDSSSFWEMSGIEVTASLTGVRVKMDSLASVVAGGIGLDSSKDGKILVDNKQEFKLYKDLNEISLEHKLITLTSKDGYNIDIETAHVYFKGVEAGDVVSFNYSAVKDQSTFEVKLKEEFKHLANKDAYFWIVEPKIGLTSIEGLSAIARGPYISLSTSSPSKKMQDKFKLHTRAPAIEGRRIRLLANKSYDLKSGVNLIYKGIVIGSLRKTRLSKDSQKVIMELVVAKKYKRLVNSTSLFYLQGALETRASLEGFYLNIGSLSSIVNGGIIVETKDLKAKKGPNSFKLLADFNAYTEASYLDDGGIFLSLRANDLKSIKKDSVVLYKGIKVGKVISFKLNKQLEKVDIKIYISKDYKDQVNALSSFYNVSGVEVQASLSELKIKTGSIESIVNGGIAFKTPLEGKPITSKTSFVLYDDEDAVDDKYVLISFTLKQDSNLKKGAVIIYKSIPIGQVKEMRLINDEVMVDALIKQEHKDLLVSDSLFWIEDIVVDLDGVQNASAALTGAYIKLLKGQSKLKADSFSLLSKAPIKTLNKKGLRIMLRGVRLSSLKEGSSVFYRQIAIGSIESFHLSKDSNGVDLQVFINPCYAYLVRKNSIFYNASAIGIDVSLLGVKISTETISTMIKGGISMVVPNEPEERVSQLHSFTLFDEPEESWLEYKPSLINEDETCK